MLETLVLLTALFVTFYALFHLIASIINGNARIKDQFWFWIIIGLPVIGSLLYFGYINRPYYINRFRERALSKSRI